MYQSVKWVRKHRVLVMIMAIVLAIPAVLGFVYTRTTHDILVYLPDDA